ncbi:MAG TPA: toxin-antitoxin system HicB family antitoxin [Pyrinomonadaceae bacterium]|nr:toxin-antitoxin system HicB family antitoxin [Pyrinomonadaceae bacterium]
MDNKYPIHIAWSEEDEAYVATCPAFPGLSAFGHTEQEAVTEAKVALKGVIEVCRKKKIPLPEPRTVGTYSGQTRLRLSKSLHRQAAAMAEVEEVSLNQYIVGALIARVTGEQVASRALAEVKRHLKEIQPTAPPNSQRVATTQGRRALSNDLSTRNPRS